MTVMVRDWRGRFGATTTQRATRAPTREELFAAAEEVAAAFDVAAKRSTEIHERLAKMRALSAEGKERPVFGPAGERPVLLDATNETLEALLTAGTRLRRLTAQVLYADGMTMDEIAAALGVSRQRVSKLLHADPEPSGPSWRRARKVRP
jgi:DNA-directed RNA polymerase specialized sigma subunit